MLKRMEVVAFAAAMALCGATVARADSSASASSGSQSYASANAPYALTMDSGTDTGTGSGSAYSTNPVPAVAPVAAPTYTPLMQGLSHIPVGGTNMADQMTKLGLTLTGYVEGGYTVNLDHHSSTTATAGPYTYHTPINAGRSFTQQARNNFLLNQADLNLTRAIDFTSRAFRNRGWDIGGTVEVNYGTDAALIHSTGLNFYHGGNYPATDPSHPYDQFDLEQAYVDIAFPIGDKSALRFRLGKFVTLLGYETINPTTNPFYSHTYLFSYAIPFTNTGALANFYLNDKWQFWAGVVRGWNQTFKQNNTAESYMGSIQYTPNSQTSVSLNAISGPINNRDNAHWTTVIDLVASVTPDMFDKKATFGFNGDYGYNGAGAGYTGPTGVQGIASHWYGTALYASYVVNKFATLNARGEWYYDGNSDFVGGGPRTDYYSGTVGVNITPMPDSTMGKYLHIRPEIRYDYATKRAFINGTNHQQWTAGADVYYTF